MHAIRQHAFGPPDVLRWEAVPLVHPGPGQVRIAVALAGVHRLDTTIRAGVAGGPLALPALPMTPGREVAGIVEAVGEDVDPGWQGRRVVAHLGAASGGYAERALAPAAALHAVPDATPLSHAVAMIGTGRTALLILDAAAIGPQDVVLVPSAAGGLGVLLVQAARRSGAAVIGLAGGPQKTALVARLGAQAVDYRADDWPGAVRVALGDRRATVLLDGVGGSVGAELTGLLGRGGRIVTFGWSGAAAAGDGASGPDNGHLDEAALAGRGLTRSTPLGPDAIAAAGGLRALETRALAAVSARELVPLVDDRFTLAEAGAAHAALEARETTGKVLLRAPSGLRAGSGPAGPDPGGTRS